MTPPVLVPLRPCTCPWKEARQQLTFLPRKLQMLRVSETVVLDQQGPGARGGSVSVPAQPPHPLPAHAEALTPGDRPRPQRLLLAFQALRGPERAHSRHRSGTSCSRLGAASASWEQEPAKGSFCQRSTGRRLSQVGRQAGLGWPHPGAPSEAGEAGCAHVPERKSRGCGHGGLTISQEQSRAPYSCDLVRKE